MGTVGARARVAKGAYVTGELTGSYQKPSQIVTFWGERVCHVAAIDRLSTVKKGYWPPLSIIGHVTYAPLSGVYECPLCSHGPRGPVGVYYAVVRVVGPRTEIGVTLYSCR